MITEKDVVSDKTVERLWSRVEAGLPRPGSRASFARAGIIAGIVALVIGGGGIASYAVVQTVKSQPATPTPSAEEVLLYPDAPAVAKMDGVTIDEAIRRMKLEPQLDRLRSDLEKAAGTRFHSVRIAREGRFGIDLALTLGLPIDAVDEIVAAHPDLVFVRYVDGLTDAELLEVLETYGRDWEEEFPSAQLGGIVDGTIELMTPDASQDEEIRAYVSAHGAAEATITFVHAVMIAE